MGELREIDVGGRSSSQNRLQISITWLSITLAIVTVIASFGVSTLAVGLYVGNIKTSLDHVIADEKQDREEWRQQNATVSMALSTLNVTFAGLAVEVKNLNRSLEYERQDRLDYEARARDPGRGYQLSPVPRNR